jgi:hypothetical protein
MRTALRRTALSFSALTLTATGTLSVMAPANAAANFTIPGVCGSGYSEVYSQTESGYDKSSDGWGVVAYIKIGYNSGNHKNCAFIQKSTTNYSYGEASGISITLRIQGDSGYYDNDGGSYKYYAGPVYLTAPNTCVSADGWEDWAGSWATGWRACG